MTKWPKKCTVCGITQMDMMQICFLPICPTFKLRMSQLKKGTTNEVPARDPDSPRRPRPEPR